ncbi:MAG: SUMF1/EgtB/PvdO family nonheme iron enzyme [Rhizonema sp. PD38]|nr:SUMF1/EgtB/PvdO family nonheme iron enzyme [Rhizonema sp. PD38]
MLRGGSWNNNPQNCRSAYRNNNDAGDRNNNIGFRVVCAAACALLYQNWRMGIRRACP